MSAQLTSTKIYYAPLSSTITSQVLSARYLDVSAFQQIDYYIPAGLTVTISISSSDTSNMSAMVWTVVASSVAGALRDRKVSDKITAIKIDRISGSGTVEVMFGLGFSKGGVPPDESVITDNLTLRGWYKADTIPSMVDGGLLSAWPDYSGNGNTLTAAGSLRPTYYKTTTAQLQNGLPTVAFNGSNAMTITTGVTGQPCTVFLVAKTIEDILNSYFLDGYSLNTMVIHRYLGVVRAYAGVTLVGQPLANFNYAVFCVTFNGASSAVRTGSTEALGNAGVLVSNGLTLGNSGGAALSVGLIGNIAEVIVANGTYSQSIKDAVCSQLSSKWNI